MSTFYSAYLTDAIDRKLWQFFKTDETFQSFNQENMFSSFLECEGELLFSLFCHCELIFIGFELSDKTRLKIELWCKFTQTIKYSID